MYGVDRKKSGIWFVFGMVEEVYVNELLDLERGRGDILNYVGEKRQRLPEGLSVGHLEVLQSVTTRPNVRHVY